MTRNLDALGTQLTGLAASVTRRERADYVASILHGLSKVADRKSFPLLSHLIHLAYTEAELARDDTKN